MTESRKPLTFADKKKKHVAKCLSKEKRWCRRYVNIERNQIERARECFVLYVKNRSWARKLMQNYLYNTWMSLYLLRFVYFSYFFFLLHVLLLRKNTMQNNHAFAYRSCKMKMKAERAHRMNGEKMICIGGGVHKTETLHHLWMDVGERAWYFFFGRPTTQ